MVDQGGLSTDAYDAALADLVAGGAAGGLPLAASALLAIAEREEWRAAGAALALGTPALWRDHRRAIRLLAQVVPVVLEHRPDALPAWIHRVAIGIGYAFPEPESSRVVTAGMLAMAVHHAGSRPEVVRDVLLATRLGLSSAATDPGHSADPLEDAAELLFSSLSGRLAPGLAAQYVLALFTESAPEDQATVARVLFS